MKKLYSFWRWYALGKSRYMQCMDRMFFSNLSSLFYQSMSAAAFVCIFTFFPLLIEQDLATAMVFLSTAIFFVIMAMLTSYFHRRHKANKNISRLTVYTLIITSYTAIISFGIYLSSITDPLRPATVHLLIIVIALFFFVTSPFFSLILTLLGWVAFLVASVLLKSPDAWVYDISNSALAILLSLVVTWRGAMLQMKSADTAISLEDERSAYHLQSIVDELTSLKNRRDFMQHLDRFLNSPRNADDVFCLALLDIDYFKNYNDHYGHSQGDKCLRAIGETLGSLGREKNIYAARLGGEEFALLWFLGDSTGVDEVLARVHADISKLNMPHEYSEAAPRITISIGAYVLRCDMEDDFNAVYEQADKMLYKAKHDGRNRSVVHRAQP